MKESFEQVKSRVGSMAIQGAVYGQSRGWRVCREIQNYRLCCETQNHKLCCETQNRRIIGETQNHRFLIVMEEKREKRKMMWTGKMRKRKWARVRWGKSKASESKAVIVSLFLSPISSIFLQFC